MNLIIKIYISLHNQHVSYIGYDYEYDYLTGTIDFGDEKVQMNSQESLKKEEDDIFVVYS